jgi:hypothetical protein
VFITLGWEISLLKYTTKWKMSNMYNSILHRSSVKEATAHKQWLIPADYILPIFVSCLS